MMNYLLKKRNKGGFTLVELIIVIAVIAILVGILMPSFSGVVGKASEKAFLASCREDLADQLAKVEGKYTKIPSGSVNKEITRTNDTSEETIFYDESTHGYSVNYCYAEGAMGWSKVSSASDNSSASTFTLGILRGSGDLAISKAVRNEYDYEKLANGLSLLPLVYKDANGEYKPLMMSWTSSEAGKVWNFTVTDGYFWEDGEKVTGEDLLYTLQKSDNYRNSTLSADKMTVTVTLDTANGRLVSGMTTMTLLPAHIYKNNANPTVEQQRMGYGPYMLNNYNENANTLSFIVNPAYTKGTPKLHKILVKMFASEDVMYTALKNGEIDMAWSYGSGVPAAYQNAISGEGFGTMKYSAGNIKTLVFNTRDGFLFSNENLRKAVSCALDYNALTGLGSSTAVIANKGIVPAAIEGYTPTAVNAKNISQFESYMSAAGYAKNGDGKYAKGGEILSFDLTYNNGDTIQSNAAEMIKNQLEPLGITVNLDGLAKANYQAKTANMMARAEGHDVNMTACIMGWTAFGMNNAGSTYVNGNNGTQGACGVFDTTYVGYVSAMTSAASMESYATAAAGAQNWYADHVPAIALYWDTNVYAYSNAYTGFVYDATLGLNNVFTWTNLRAT